MHPVLARPISQAAFMAEFSALWLRVRGLPARPTAQVVFSDKLARVHCRSSRRYAEVDVGRRIFYFAPQILLLPRAQRLGLVAHEIGHVLMGARAHPEWTADCAAFDDLSVSISYDRRWPGKGLQTGRFVRCPKQRPSRPR